MKKLTVSLLVLLFAAPVAMQAQKYAWAQSNTQGAGLPVNVEVLANGARTHGVKVEVFQENRKVGDFTVDKKKFDVALDLQTNYTIVLQKDGFQPKSVFVDTRVPEGVINTPTYLFTANLEPADKFTHSDPFYLDFPGALVRWDENQKAFDQITGYLDDVQSKVAQLKVQLKPR